MNLILLAACQPELGPCDEPRARSIVYDLDGQPAYEGQALIIQSCGAGAFCHSEGIDAELRFGAPAGLELDLRLASQTPDVAQASLDRLRRSQASIFYERRHVFGQVERGAMPPRGVSEVPLGVPEFQRIPEGAMEGPALPSLETDEGRAILGNWLACGAPVIERTLPRADGNDNTVGATVETVETTPVDPVWSAIYPRIIERSCAFTLCHDAETAAGALDMSSASQALAALRGDAGGLLCGSRGGSRVTPGDPEASLLIHKLRGVGPAGRVCGSRMPSAGSYLSEGRIASIEMWIANGANDD